jgi:hypothetical protein
MIVFVFDPLAVLILISVTGNHTKKDDESKISEESLLPFNTYEIYLEDNIDIEDNTALGLTKE